MPKRTTATSPGARKVMKNTAFESTVASWLMWDGWQVFLPMLDHGHKTDILISDGPNYYRVQIKTVDDGLGEDQVVENRWAGSHCDVVVYFARGSTWAYVAPAFEEKKRRLNHETHIRFSKSSKNEFLKAFHKL